MVYLYILILASKLLGLAFSVSDKGRYLCCAVQQGLDLGAVSKCLDPPSPILHVFPVEEAPEPLLWFGVVTYVK